MSKPIKPDHEETRDTEPVDPSRRRILGMVKYVPPVVLGVISLQQAGCQPAPSCVPTGGCGPSGTPCVPSNCPPNGGCPPAINNPNSETGPSETGPTNQQAEVDPSSSS